jgi:hypothetical protein
MYGQSSCLTTLQVVRGTSLSKVPAVPGRRWSHRASHRDFSAVRAGAGRRHRACTHAIKLLATYCTVCDLSRQRMTRQHHDGANEPPACCALCKHPSIVFAAVSTHLSAYTTITAGWHTADGRSGLKSCSQSKSRQDCHGAAHGEQLITYEMKKETIWLLFGRQMLR